MISQAHQQTYFQGLGEGGQKIKKFVTYLTTDWFTFFGQRLPRGRCPVEHRRTFVCLFLCWAAAPKGTMSCRTQGDFRSFVRACVRTCVPPLETQISASRLKSQPQGSNPSLEGSNPNLKSSNPGLEAQIPASIMHGRMNKRTKVPLCSTGHRPLRGRCPATDHLQTPTYKAGQRVSLTTYCPWATGRLVDPYHSLQDPILYDLWGLMRIFQRWL